MDRDWWIRWIVQLELVLQCRAVLLLLFLEPPHFRQSHQEQNPHNAVREVPPELRGKFRIAVAPVGLAAPENATDIDAVGLLRRKPATHVDELEVGADEAVRIQTGRLSTLVARLDAVGDGIVQGIVLILPVLDEPLPLVPAVVANEFTTHGVGEDVRAAVVVARDPAAAIPSPRRKLSSKGAEGSKYVVDLRPAAVLLVGQAGVAVGHAIASLAPEAGKVLAVFVGVAEPRIKYLAAVAALGVLLLGVAFRTGTLSRGNRFASLTDNFVAVVVVNRADVKGCRVFQSGAVTSAKLPTEFRACTRV